MVRGLLILCLIAAAIFGISVWFNQLSEHSTEAVATHQPDDIDYQMTGFKAVIFNSDGIATQRIRGEQLKHFPYDNRYEINQPKGETLQGEKQWHIQSDSVTTADGLSELHWRDNVHINQTAEQSLDMQTSYLIQRPNQHQASTKSGVEMSTLAGKSQLRKCI